MKTLPESVKVYKRTPVFNQDSIPKGLLSEHSTKPGAWGLLTIESGQLTYFVTEPGYEEEVTLTPNNPGVIEPSTNHHIQADGPVSFFIQFYK